MMKSYYIGTILDDARLPIPNHVTVVLIKWFILVFKSCQMELEARMFVNYSIPVTYTSINYR